MDSCSSRSAAVVKRTLIPARPLRIPSLSPDAFSPHPMAPAYDVFVTLDEAQRSQRLDLLRGAPVAKVKSYSSNVFTAGKLPSACTSPVYADAGPVSPHVQVLQEVHVAPFLLHCLLRQPGAAPIRLSSCSRSASTISRDVAVRPSCGSSAERVIDGER